MNTEPPLTLAGAKNVVDTSLLPGAVAETACARLRLEVQDLRGATAAQATHSPVLI